MSDKRLSGVGLFLFGVLLLGAVNPVRASAEQADPGQAASLQSRVSTLEQQVRQHQDAGIVLWLFAAFCALWAQNTRRNPWLWFFMGLIFSVITVLVLLRKNADDAKPSAFDAV